MKKTLVAMAALSALSAMAQSTVTLYGNIDYSYTLSPEKVEVSGTNANGTAAATTTTKTTALRAVGANRNFSSNAIGFRGTEDLGNGLKANFQVETAITGNQGDGTTGNTLFSNNGANSTRDTWVGLSGGFGEVRVGHQSTHEFAKNSLAEAGSVNLIQNLNGLAGFGRQGRHDMISYVTPTFNGLNGTIQWGKAGVKGTDSTNTQDTQNGRSHMNLGLDYTNGKLVLAAGTRTGKTNLDGTRATASAALAIDQSGLTTVIPTAAAAGQTFNLEAKTKANYIYANYDLGAAKVFAGYTTHKATFAGSLAGVAQNGFTNKSKQTNVGVQVPMGAFTPWVSIARGKQYENDSATGAQTTWGSDKLKSMSLGTTYAMSKRTSMYAVYNTLKVDTTFDASAATAKSKTTQTLVGIRHQF